MYYLLLIILYPLALLPLRVLYVLSDAMFFLAYHVFRYRRDTVMDNLQHAFPEKTAEELRQICKRFYKSFCDQWIETLKLLTMSRSELDKRMKGNWEVFDQLYEEGKNAYLFLGHNFNWEWVNLAQQQHAKQLMAGMYLPLESDIFDKLMLKIRTGSGLMVSVKSTKSAFQRLKGQQYILALIADQNPSNLNKVLWLPFMNREVPFFMASTQMARREKVAIIFGGISKTSRGHYYYKLERFCDDAAAFTTEDILKAYVSFLENHIRSQPENWLWTHRRWKHTPPATEQ